MEEKSIIFQRGLPDWLFSVWTLPSVCEIRGTMQVVNKELTCDWVNFKVAKSEFCS